LNWKPKGFVSLLRFLEKSKPRFEDEIAGAVPPNKINTKQEPEENFGFRLVHCKQQCAAPAFGAARQLSCFYFGRI